MQYSVQVLRSSLEIFFPPYLANLDFSSQDILDVLDGIRYVPVSRDEYLRATHCVFRLENKFSQIRRSVLLFDGHLVWSGLLQQDTRTLFRYLLQVMSEVG